MTAFTVDKESFYTTETMFYGCCRRHFVSFYSQSIIEFKLALHNAVARKQYYII